MSQRIRRILMCALTTMILAAAMTVSASAAKVDIKANVALRAEPSSKSELLNVLTPSVSDRTVKGISKSGNWIKVTYKNETGYVSASKVEFVSGDLGKFKLTFYGGDTETASGRTPQLNHTIAVDPRLIALGSRVFIEGYGTYYADDTGGAIKGNIIDIFVESEAVANRLGIDFANVVVY